MRYDWRRTERDRKEHLGHRDDETAELRMPASFLLQPACNGLTDGLHGQGPELHQREHHIPPPTSAAPPLSKEEHRSQIFYTPQWSCIKHADQSPAQQRRKKPALGFRGEQGWIESPLRKAQTEPSRRRLTSDCSVLRWSRRGPKREGSSSRGDGVTFRVLQQLSPWAEGRGVSCDRQPKRINTDNDRPNAPH